MKKIIYTAMLASVLGLSSCIDSLNQEPIVESGAEDVYNTAFGCKQALGKLYVSYVIAGQEFGGGDADLSTSGSESFDFMRCYINLQEACTDEMVYTWASGDNLLDITYITWDSSDPWVTDCYYRVMYTVALCNDFLKHTTEDAMAGFTAEEQENVLIYRAEARFMRALSYWYMLDLFGQAPYVDETTPNVDYSPEAYTSNQLFEYIESELLAIENEMIEPGTNEYGRADRAAAWALLGRLYLNASVYTGTDRSTDCITYCKKIIDSNVYSLESNYASLFNADNHLRTNEIIYAFPVDATTTVSWGTTTYLCAGAVSNDNSIQNPANYGLTSGWGSYRVRGEFAALFGDGAEAIDNSGDSRCLLFTNNGTIGQYLDNGVSDDNTGFRSEKWTNLTDAGEIASNTQSNGVNTDFPVFRLADVYLMIAESVLRGGSGYSRSEALDFLNDLRERAYGDESGNITDAQMNLDYIIDERGRELYLECVRRTDLIRFGYFTSDHYLWQWKGGVLAGRGVNNRYNVYPIPANEIAVNPNLSNPNY